MVVVGGGQGPKLPVVPALLVGVGQASRFVAQNAVQLHGGIGMTEEYAVGHYFRRCMVIEHMFGDTAHHLSRLADEVK